MKLSDEPAALTNAISAAVIATVNVIGFVMGWSSETIVGLNVAAAAWIGVLGFWIRAQVVPLKPLNDFADAVEAKRVPEFP
jgi:hypothetical protein